MIIGVIFAAFQSADLLNASLAPWIEARRKRLGDHDYRIAAVSVPFVGFPQDETPDNTVSVLKGCLAIGQIDTLITQTTPPLKETEARGFALKWLVGQKVDTLWQVDADERYTQDDITRIVAFTEANPLVPWFRLSLRNAVFDAHTFLAEPFTPPRIHRVNVGKGTTVARADGFWDDNNVIYNRGVLRDFVRDTDLASMTVPASVAAIKHLSWLSDSRSRRKVAYQVAREWECSFRWDEVKGLQFNEAYYAKRGLPLPEVTHD